MDHALASVSAFMHNALQNRLPTKHDSVMDMATRVEHPGEVCDLKGGCAPLLGVGCASACRSPRCTSILRKYSERRFELVQAPQNAHRRLPCGRCGFKPVPLAACTVAPRWKHSSEFAKSNRSQHDSHRMASLHGACLPPGPARAWLISTTNGPCVWHHNRLAPDVQPRDSEPLGPQPASDTDMASRACSVLGRDVCTPRRAQATPRGSPGCLALLPR